MCESHIFRPFNSISFGLGVGVEYGLCGWVGVIELNGLVYGMGILGYY